MVLVLAAASTAHAEGSTVLVFSFENLAPEAMAVAVPATPAQAPVIVQIDLEDIVHPVSADYVKEGLDHAKDIGARAVILRLSTPGGLIDSMREIVEAVLSSSVPVITWVGPNGARAASAGFFILLAGDVAVMAPGTNSGAAHIWLNSGCRKASRSRPRRR